MTRILVVEDNEEMSDLLARLGRSWGYEVDQARDAAGAIAEMDARPYDLVIMDLRLDGRRCGIEAAREIRAMPGDRGRTPIVALTGGMVRTTAAEMLSAGFQAVLQKPILPGELRKEINRHVRVT